MATRLGTWETAGPADASRVRSAVRVDAVLALFAAMLLWPFPVMRATLPWSIHGPLILLFIWFVAWLYPVVCLMIWGRTLGMYLFDLGFSGADRPFRPARVARWSAGFALVAVPLLTLGGAHPETGLAARFSGLTTVASR